MTHSDHKLRTLTLISVLHGFTHIYQVALLPLYLPMQRAFKLESVGSSTFLVTLMMLSYFIPSYPLGVLADRVSRKKLLGLGLAINGLGFIGLALAPNYPAALAAMVVAGLGGSFFHPAATALIARLFPVNTGRALGIIGMGAGAGFFLGPIYSGWRATQSGNWRTPVLELGVSGLVAAGVFYWLAVEMPAAAASSRTKIRVGAEPASRTRLFSGVPTAVLFVVAAFAFSLRDFTGNGMGSLGALFLQHAHGLSVKQTGVTLSGIFLASIISNPLFGHLSDGGRKRWTCLVLGLAAVIVVAFPHLPGPRPALSFFAFMTYGFFFMASYPMVEAAVMQAVPDAVRGRAFGLWITLGGSTGNLSHWLVGRWVEGLGPRADAVASYFPAYAFLACLLLLSLLGLPCLESLHRRELAAGRTGSRAGVPGNHEPPPDHGQRPPMSGPAPATNPSSRSHDVA